MINQIAATPNPKKKCLAQCFPSHVFYLRKKKTTFWILQKKPKVKQKKTPNCHKTKTRMKERKKSSKTTSHTTYSTHPIEAPQHTHTNSLKLHPCHQINQSTKLPIFDFYSSLI